MDEPTAALAVREVQGVLDLIRQLKAEGIGVILISHRLNDVLSVTDRIVVLRHGRAAANLATAETDMAEVVSAIVGGARNGRCCRSRSKGIDAMAKLGLHTFAAAPKWDSRRCGDFSPSSGAQGARRSKSRCSTLRRSMSRPPALSGRDWHRACLLARSAARNRRDRRPRRGSGVPEPAFEVARAASGLRARVRRHLRHHRQDLRCAANAGRIRRHRPLHRTRGKSGQNRMGSMLGSSPATATRPTS